MSLDVSYQEVEFVKIGKDLTPIAKFFVRKTSLEKTISKLLKDGKELQINIHIPSECVKDVLNVFTDDVVIVPRSSWEKIKYFIHIATQFLDKVDTKPRSIQQVSIDEFIEDLLYIFLKVGDAFTLFEIYLRKCPLCSKEVESRLYIPVTIDVLNINRRFVSIVVKHEGIEHIVNKWSVDLQDRNNFRKFVNSFIEVLTKVLNLGEASFAKSIAMDKASFFIMHTLLIVTRCKNVLNELSSIHLPPERYKLWKKLQELHELREYILKLKKEKT